jgi:hypothetical protein
MAKSNENARRARFGVQGDDGTVPQSATVCRCAGLRTRASEKGEIATAIEVTIGSGAPSNRPCPIPDDQEGLPRPVSVFRLSLESDDSPDLSIPGEKETE